MPVYVNSAAASRQAFDITESFQHHTDQHLHLDPREESQDEEHDLTLQHKWGKQSYMLVGLRCPDPLEKNVSLLLAELAVYEEHVHCKSLCSTSTASDASLRRDFDEFSHASDPFQRTSTVEEQVGTVRSSSRSELISPDRASELLRGETGPRDTFATPTRYQSLQSQWFLGKFNIDFFPNFLLSEPLTMPGLPLPKPENTPVLAGPANVATERPPSPEVEHPLFTSIRRVLSTNSSFKAEDLIAAIKKRSNPEPPTVDSSPGEASEVPSGQASTSKCGGKRTFSQSGISGSSASHGKRTLACPHGKGAEDSEDDGDGGDRGISTPRDKPDESGKPQERWACPYRLRYIKITEVKEFKSCESRFPKRDNLRTHLQRYHHPPKRRHEHLPHYYMNDAQWAGVEKVMDGIARPQGRSHNQEAYKIWLNVQIAWYREVWRILFPDSTHVPQSPFHLSNAELNARCHRVVGAMMDDIRRQEARAKDPSSAEGPWTSKQVYEMLDTAIAIGLDSAPGYAQRFGDGLLRQAGEGLPLAAAATTSVPHEAERPGASTPQEVDTAGARAAADLLTPVSSEGATRTETTTPQPAATVLDTPPVREMRLEKTSDALLHSDRSISITVHITPTLCSLKDQQEPVARIKVTAPWSFMTHISDPSEILPINDPTQPPMGVEPVDSNVGVDLFGSWEPPWSGGSS